MAEKFLNETGFAYYDAKLRSLLAGKADAAALPTKVSELENDKGFVTESRLAAYVAGAVGQAMDGAY